MLKSVAESALAYSKFSAEKFSTYLSLAVGICIGMAYVFWAWTNQLGGFTDDNAAYMLMAQYLVPFETASLAATHIAQTSQFPVLGPLLIALLGGAYDALIAHLITVGFVLAAMLVLYRWVLVLGMTKGYALLVITIFATSNATYIQALNIQSENIFIFFSLLAIYHSAKTSQSLAALLLMALFAGLAWQVRSSGVAIVLAVIVFASVKKWKQTISWQDFSLIMAALFAPKLLIDVFSFKLDDHADYMKMAIEKYSQIGSSGNVWAHFISQLQGIRNGWQASFLGPGVTNYLLDFVGVVSVGAALVRAWRCYVDGFFSLFYLLVLLVWPWVYESSRYVFPLVPVLLVQVLWVSVVFARHWSVVSVFPVVLLAVILLGNMPTLALTAERFFSPLPKGFEEYRRHPSWYLENLNEARWNVMAADQVVKGIRRMGQYVGPEECVYSVKSALVGYYANRVSYDPPPEGLDAARFASAVSVKGCHHFLLLPFTALRFSKYYPAGRLGSPTIVYSMQLPESSGVASMLVRTSE